MYNMQGIIESPKNCPNRLVLFFNAPPKIIELILQADSNANLYGSKVFVFHTASKWKSETNIEEKRV